MEDNMEKRRRIICAILLTVFIGASIGIAFAADPFTGNGNERKGKYMYRKNCRSCHDGSGSAELSPSSKTQAQWERTFKRYERLECIEEWNKLQHGDLNDIYSYLYGHAYDSPQPATCE